MTTGIEHLAAGRLRRLGLTAAAMLAAILVPVPTHASALISGVTGADLNVSVVSAVSTPRHDAGEAVHVVTFLITNPDSRPSTVDGIGTWFGTHVAGATLAIPDPRDPSRNLGCRILHADAPRPPNEDPGPWVSSVMVDCDAFELAGHTSTTAVVTVTSFASGGDAPLSVPLRIYADDDPNVDNNTAATIVEFDGDPNSTFTTTTTTTSTTTTIVQAPALTLDTTTNIDPRAAGLLPQTGNAPSARRTALAALLLVVAGACLAGISRRRYRPLR